MWITSKLTHALSFVRTATQQPVVVTSQTPSTVPVTMRCCCCIVIPALQSSWFRSLWHLLESWFVGKQQVWSWSSSNPHISTRAVQNRFKKIDVQKNKNTCTGAKTNPTLQNDCRCRNCHCLSVFIEVYGKISDFFFVSHVQDQTHCGVYYNDVNITRLDAKIKRSIKCASITTGSITVQEVHSQSAQYTYSSHSFPFNSIQTEPDSEMIIPLLKKHNVSKCITELHFI